MAVVVVRRVFLEKNRDPVKRFIQAYSEAIHEFKTNKDKMIAVYNQRLKQRNPEVIEQTYSYFATIFFLPPRVPLDGARYTLELITQRSPASKSAPTNWSGKASSRSSLHGGKKLIHIPAAQQSKPVLFTREIDKLPVWT